MFIFFRSTVIGRKYLDTPLDQCRTDIILSRKRITAGNDYLSACALLAAATGDAKLKQRVDYMVDRMAECQQAAGDGGIYAYAWDKDVWFTKLRAGELIPVAVTAWYGVHKVMAGLRDAYQMCGNEKARAALIRLSDWCIDVTAKLTDEQWQQMLAGEHGGPHEVLADVFAMTGDRKYLDCAMRFRHDRVFAPLSRGDDTALNNIHANTQIPKFIGYERIYELTGDKAWHNAAANFWRIVTTRHSWVTGGNSQWERFFPPNEFPKMLNEQCGPETCNTYNMLKLTRELYASDPSAAYVDYYERALYNSILPSIDREHGGFVYYTSMRPDHYRVYSRDFDAFWCCVGTGMENPGKFGEMIYARNADTLWVNLFIPSKLIWNEKGLILKQETRFPERPSTSLTFTIKQPQKLALNIRYPAWVAPGALKVAVNGAPYRVAAEPGTYVTVKRTWKTGDRVNVALPMRITEQALPYANDQAAFLYGPIVLAAPLGTAGLVPADFHGGGDGSNQLATKVIPVSKAPMVVEDLATAASRIRPVAGKPLIFATRGLSRPFDITLVPFYTVGHQRYAIYFRATDEAHFLETQRAAQAEEREALDLEQRTVDHVRIGEQQSETDHKLTADRSNTGSASWPYTHWRDATGSFGYALKVIDGQAMALRCVYWGGDTDRRFEIRVNGTLIATQALTGERVGETLAVTYPIPAEVIKGSAHVSVTFTALPGSTAGGLFDLRVVRMQ